MSEKAPAWVDPVMRAGYAARGIVYLIVGGLAVLAAVAGGSAEGTEGALRSLPGTVWGQILLWIIVAGLIAYAVWRFMAAAMDLKDKGADLAGIVGRMGMVVIGLIHLALAFTAGRMALGGGGGQGGGGTQGVASWLMSKPYGHWVVAAIGLCTIGGGIYYAWKAVSEHYKEEIRSTSTTEKLDPVCKFGLIAHGIVIVMIGCFLVWAGWTSDPSEAGGLKEAFETVRGAAFGRILFGAMAFGMLAFAAYCFIEAVYLVLPTRAGPDTETLASRMRDKARRHLG